MATKIDNTVNNLWDKMRDAIDAAYKVAKDKDSSALRDYARDKGWHDGLEKLLADEMANERQHRKGWPSGSRSHLTVQTASRMILINQAANGATAKAIPPATDFLVYRRTAVEAQVVGWLIRAQLSQEWLTAASALDYAKEQNGAA